MSAPVEQPLLPAAINDTAPWSKLRLWTRSLALFTARPTAIERCKQRGKLQELTRRRSVVLIQRAFRLRNDSEFMHIAHVLRCVSKLRAKRAVRKLQAQFRIHMLKRVKAQVSDQLRKDKVQAVQQIVQASRHAHRHTRRQASVKLVEAGELVEWKSQLWRFIHHPTSKVKDPAQLGSIIGEIFTAVLAVCWLLTAVYSPEVIRHNDLRSAWGYNNVCVGLDTAPARQVGAVAWVFVAGVTFEYVRVVIARQRALRKEGKIRGPPALGRFFAACHLSYGLGTAVFILCFVIPPDKDLYGHTRPFLAFIATRYLSMMAWIMEHYLEDDPRIGDIPRPVVVYLAVFGGLSLWYLVIPDFIYAHFYAHRDEPGFRPWLPWWLTASMDYGWLLTNTVSGLYLPAQALMVGDNVLHGTTLTNLRNAFGAKKPTQSPAVEKVVEYFRAMGDDAVAKDPSADAVVGLTVTVMRGELAIDERALENLLPSQRVGLFASAATYDAAVRINVTEHGAARLSIRLNVPDSMALLSECETCSSRPGYRQIDLLLAENFKQFMFRSVDELARLMSMQFEPRLSTALSHPLSLLNSIRDHRRATSALDNTQGVLGKAFYAGLPFKLGPGAAKLGLQPRQTQPLQAGHFPGGVAGARLTGREEETAAAYGAAMVDWINARAAGAGEPVAIWDLVVQPATEHPSHSVEVDGPWDEAASPYVPVGTFSLLPGPATLSDAPSKFSPWNQLQAHRPLGALNAARRHVYKAHREARLRAGSGKSQDRVCPFLAMMPVAPPTTAHLGASPAASARSMPELCGDWSETDSV